MIKLNQLTRLAPYSTSVYTQTCKAMNRGVLSDPWFIGLIKGIRWKKRYPKNAKGLSKKTSCEKRGTPKTQRGLTKRPPMKKRCTPKHTTGLNKRTSDEKRGTSKNAKGVNKTTSDEKRSTPKT
jgi:hypothetical protein